MILIGLLLRGLLRLAGRLLFLFLVLSVTAKLVTFGLALYAEEHHDQVEALASRLLDTPVQMEKIETSWRGFTPRLWLRQLTVGGEQETLLLGDVLVAVNFRALPWWRDNLPISVVLTGTRIRVERDAEGHTRILGLLKPGGTLNPPARVLVRNATIEWVDRKRDARFEESHLDLQLLSRGNRSRLSVRSRKRRLLIRGDIEGKLTTSDWSARFWAEGENLHTSQPLQPYLPEGYRIDGLQFDFQAWSHWKKGSHQSTRLQFHFDEARLRHGNGAPLAIGDLAGDLLYEVNEGGWSLQLAGLSLRLGDAPRWPALDAALLASEHQKLLGVSVLDLEATAPLLDFLPLTGEQRQALAAMAPGGRLEQLRFITGPAPKAWIARAGLDNLHTSPWKKIPGLNGIRGELFAEPGKLRLTLDSQDARIDMRPLFRSPIDLHRLSGELEWRRTGGESWVLEGRDLHASNADLDTFTRLHLAREAGQPLHIDMQTDFRDGDGTHASRYYPVGIMKEKLVKWLDDAILMGRIPRGSFILSGPLDHFPFHKTHDGHFEVLFQAEQLKLRYHEKWPPLEETYANVRFHNNSLVIEADRSRIYHTRLENVLARIPSLKPLSHLEVSGTAVGPLADQFRLLRETPLKATLARRIEEIEVAGNGRMQIKLHIPFKSRNYGFEGRLQLKNAALTLTRHQLTISRLRGELEIDKQGIRGRKIRGRALGTDIEFDITPGKRFTRIDARGMVPAAGLIRQYGEFALLGPKGATQIHLELDLPNSSSTGEKETLLRIHSNLEGMELQLPPPLGKKAREVRRLEASLTLAGALRRVTLRLDDDLGLTLRSEAPGESNLSLHLARLPLRHWINWFGELPPGAGNGIGPQTIRIQTDLLEAYPLLAPDLTLELERAPDSWRGNITSSAIAGRFHYDLRPASRKLSLNLEHLKLATDPHREQTPAPDKSRDVPVDPRRIASLDLRSKAFHFNDAKLGKLTVKTLHDGKGQLIEELSLTGGIAEIKASGAWIHEGQSSITRLDGMLNTPDMGRFLREALGMDFLDGSKGYFSFDLSWPGAPYQFDLASLQGRLQLDMTAGRFLNIKPGAARILGLLNVRAIGRRLQFGFKDVYEKGLAFDTIMGSFQLDNGHIYTNDLEISAPSSTIRISGSTNLVNRTHDQVVTVSPRLDATLPLAGAILGGPTTGLVVLLAQQALAGKLEEAQRITYTITGPWDEPEVKPLKKKQPHEKATDILDR